MTNVFQRVALDVIFLGSLGLALLFERLFGVPFQRGFFCDDETIMYPVKDSSVPSLVLYFVGIGLPTVVMLITEVNRARKTQSPQNLYLFEWKLPLWTINSYKSIGVFLFGAASQQTITDIGKYVIGRLRPHFIAACQPNINCSTMGHTYVEHYTCAGDASAVREARLSFPSGHSSFSMFCSLYLVLYIQARVHIKRPKLLKPTMQLLILWLSWGTALSRISDNKHHWSDVTVGLIIGSVAAIITAFHLSDLFKEKISVNEGESSQVSALQM